VLRRLRWLVLGIAAGVGAYVLAGALLSSRFDGRVAAFRASEAYADLERRSEDVPADENAVSLFAEAAALLELVPEEHATFANARAWDPDEAPPGAEIAHDALERHRVERRAALPSLEPFVAALAAALERPAVQQPLNGHTTLWFATAMLPFRARLLPERAAESGDLLLKLGTKWRARDVTDPLGRHRVVQESLRIVREVLARDPAQAACYFRAWRALLAEEEPLALLRFQCAIGIRSIVEVAEQVRRGVDPFARTRETLRELAESGADIKRREGFFQTPWTFRWYARPVFYWSMTAAIDASTSAIEAARTEAGLRDLLQRPGLDRVTAIVGVRMLEEIALVRLALSAMAAAAREPLPDLENPFTGRPLAVRETDAAIVIEAVLPESFRDRVEAPSSSRGR
jgi:hypothetical protein